MEWVNRYLDQVGQYRPEAQRADVTGDLRAAIEGELEGLAESRGAPWTEADEKAVLQRFGHPMKVARDYYPLRYLIGPELYPSWWQAMKQVAVLVLGLGVVLALLYGVATGWRVGPLALLERGLGLLLWSLVAVTGIFVALEATGERLGNLDRWTPERLPRDSRGVIERGDVITNLFSEGVFLLWWNDVLVLADWLPAAPEALPFAPGAAWDNWFWPLNLVLATAFALHLWVLLRGFWQRPGLWLELLTCAGVVIGCTFLALADDLITLSAADGAGPRLQQAMAYAERTLRTALLVVAGFATWDGWKALRRLRG